MKCDGQEKGISKAKAIKKPQNLFKCKIIELFLKNTSKTHTVKSTLLSRHSTSKVK